MIVGFSLFKLDFVDFEPKYLLFDGREGGGGEVMMGEKREGGKREEEGGRRLVDVGRRWEGGGGREEDGIDIGGFLIEGDVLKTCGLATN